MLKLFNNDLGGIYSCSYEHVSTMIKFRNEEIEHEKKEQAKLRGIQTFRTIQ